MDGALKMSAWVSNAFPSATWAQLWLLTKIFVQLALAFIVGLRLAATLAVANVWETGQWLTRRSGRYRGDWEMHTIAPDIPVSQSEFSASGEVILHLHPLSSFRLVASSSGNKYSNITGSLFACFGLNVVMNCLSKVRCGAPIAFLFIGVFVEMCVVDSYTGFR